jgi:hypothetical protein
MTFEANTLADTSGTDVQSRSGVFDDALHRFLTAQTKAAKDSWEQRLIAQGSSAVGDALLRLSFPQPPEIVDVLVKLLAFWSPIDSIVPVASDRNASWNLRTALLQVLVWHWPNTAHRPQIGSVFAELARKDPDPKIRFAAVEAIEAVGAGQRLEEILSQLAGNDSSPSVREAAKSALGET